MGFSGGGGECGCRTLFTPASLLEGKVREKILKSENSRQFLIKPHDWLQVSNREKAFLNWNLLCGTGRHAEVR